MKRPYAYVCSPFRGDTETNVLNTRQYCRQLYEAGYTPIAPHLMFPQFMDDNIPEERRAAMEMGNTLLRRCAVLVVCGDRISEGMMLEIMLAKRLNITATTLDGILTVQAQGKAATGN